MQSPLGSATVFPPIHDFGKKGNEQQPAGEKEYEESGHIGCQSAEIVPQLLLFRRRPTIPGITLLHEELHEPVHMPRLTE